jgi:diamine N-acetyltransferase
MREYLPPEWTTERIRIRDSKLADVPRLTALFNACHYVAPWDPTFQLVAESELAELVTKSLSTTGETAAFRLQYLESVDGRTPIGYFHVQHHSPNLPQADTAFISMFVIHPDHQGQRYGQEVAAGLARQLAERGYVAVWLEVYLKNWPALRFWLQQGFDKIIEYDGDKQFSQSAQATLVLEKRL